MEKTLQKVYVDLGNDESVSKNKGEKKKTD